MCRGGVYVATGHVGDLCAHVRMGAWHQLTKRGEQEGRPPSYESASTARLSSPRAYSTYTYHHSDQARLRKEREQPPVKDPRESMRLASVVSGCTAPLISFVLSL